MAENTMTIDQSEASGRVAAGLRRAPAAHLAAEMAQVGRAFVQRVMRRHQLRRDEDE